MKVSLNWLREFVKLPADVPALCELLTLAGIEVENIATRGAAIDHVVVAQISESTQHPNADRLSVCQVDDGSGQPRQIVCGAKNYKVGDKVPLALPGAILPGDFKIKVGKLRGVESQGMLCSAKELQLADDAEGLLILPPTARVGAPIAELFPEETILDLEITPNRSDLLSHLGIAREIAALTGVELTGMPEPRSVSSDAGGIKIDILATEQCPFYTATKISDVKIGASPEWLRQKLESIGLRSINNVVDVTNFVMYEMGEPLHAFDADTIRGEIRVRLARDGEEFVTLDGDTRKLDARDLVIADEERAMAIAGVMGGKETGVTESTRNVILESAYFQPESIRRTSRRLELMSDSSYRFERGVDPDGVIPAAFRAAELIAQIGGGQIVAHATNGNRNSGERKITLRYARCHQLLGMQVESARIDSILTGFGLKKIDANEAESSWQIPSHRRLDLTREVDLIEEITRVVGIENIPASCRGSYAASTPTDRAHDRKMQVRRVLAARGFYEARTLTLLSDKAAEEHFFPYDDLRRLRNPLGEDQVILRPDLLPGLLRVVAQNIRAGTRDLRLFEIGRSFRTSEHSMLSLVVTGSTEPKSWRNSSPRTLDLFDLKGVIDALGLCAITFNRVENPRLAIALSLECDGIRIGEAGQLSPSQARTMDVQAPVVFASIDLAILENSIDAPAKFSALPRFPSITRDIAMIVPAAISHGAVAAIFHEAKEPLLTDVSLFDVFIDARGEKVATDKKSLAYSLTYRADDRTLTTSEVNAAHERIKGRLRAGLGVDFRE